MSSSQTSGGQRHEARPTASVDGPLSQRPSAICDVTFQFSHASATTTADAANPAMRCVTVDR